MGGVISMSLVNMALAAPTGGQVVAGSATISQNGNATVIDQTSQVAKIDWTSFSTTVNESVTFNQNNSSSLAINEVVGGVPSFLMGSLNANGRVFIINQAGIIFGKSSRVNVGSLLATTSALTSLDENTGQMTFANDNGGKVINHGNITVSDGGFAVLAAPYVENTGYIQANLGHIELASARDRKSVV